VLLVGFFNIHSVVCRFFRLLARIDPPNVHIILSPFGRTRLFSDASPHGAKIIICGRMYFALLLAAGTAHWNSLLSFFTQPQSPISHSVGFGVG
jgi:hypothetical protein